MNGKFISILGVLIILFSMGSCVAQSDENCRRYNHTLSIETMNEKGYDPEVYGKLLISTEAVEIDHMPKDLSLEMKEGIEIELNIEFNESRIDFRFLEQMDIDEPLRDFSIKFLLINEEKWVPSFKSERDQARSFGHDNAEQFGKNYEALIKEQDEWYESLEGVTDNVYDLDVEMVHLNHETNSTQTTASLSINQGGRWYLSTFFKPSGGDYWVRSGSIPIDVEEPTDMFHKSLPIIATSLTAAPVLYLTWKIKKRQ